MTTVENQGRRKKEDQAVYPDCRGASQSSVLMPPRGHPQSFVLTEVWEALADVPDPELPMISVVDLGIIRSVERDAAHVRVEVMPTFVACPALDIIRAAICERLTGFAPTIEVVTTFAEPWTTERITPEGRRKLRASGFAPPLPGEDLGLPVTPACPYCGSHHTALENPFGPTLCRAIYYCHDCRQPFEQFKAV
ncbi:MAG: phenylacetate-CoA oxygenase subunit PaaJ [Thermomicrobia bacterium]|nr:phenylacetate-CoA oxygenase subunit PaaJ [Thermomicrobia bacterium]